MLVWLEIFAAAWLSTSKLLEGTAREQKYIGKCDRKMQKKVRLR